jgi:rhodanese-related sulfurtransferase
MKTLLTSALLTISFGLASTSFANSPAAAKDSFKLIHVKELKTAMAANKEQVYVYDANTEETRKTEGVIPGATKLQDVTSYDAGQVLPKDKNANLIFYCANTQCTASHSAAKRAVEAGYKNVSVLADGIQGWKKAGEKTEAFN